jgi:diguanylate cyclase (GGDEF)-like protein
VIFFSKKLGKFLQSQLRTEDIACRYGGEEFTIVLLDCSFEDAYKRAEKMRQDVKTIDVQYVNERIESITLSIGISLYPDNGNTTEVLLRSADKALYEAKNSGRDRVIKFNGI